MMASAAPTPGRRQRGKAAQSYPAPKETHEKDVALKALEGAALAREALEK